MLRIAICDDEPEQIVLLKNHIIRILFRLDMDADIFEFTSGDALLKNSGAGQGFEVIFLDIKMKDNNGIETAKQIHEQDRKALVIFVTGRTEYMQMGYEARAFRYILKPASEPTIEEVIRQALKEIQLSERGCFRFKEKGGETRVDINDIIYFEAQNHRLNVICAKAVHSFYGRISDIEKQLSGKGFVRCQKGFLVNAVHIRRIGKTGILLDNGSMLPVSSNYLRQTKDTFISVLR